jgi:FHS family glucose/mannose:H+ symporter-like MFS transporter
VIGIATLPADKPVEPRERSAQPQNRSIPLLVCLLTAPMFFLYIGIENVWAGWATSYAQRLNPSDQTWTYAPAFFWAALLAGRALAPVILKRVSEQQLLLLDLSAAVLAGCVFLAARSLAVLFPALAVMGFALSSIYPNLIARMTRDLEGNTGAAGYMFASASAGGAVLPWAVGAFSNHFGSIRMAFLLPVAGSLVMLAIQVYRLRRSATAIGEFASNAGD